MRSRSIFVICLLSLFVVGFGVGVHAQEPQAVAPETEAGDTLATASVDVPVSNNTDADKIATESTSLATSSPLLEVGPQSPLTSSDLAGFGFQLCSSQSQCDNICAPFGGICWRQFCICD